MVINNNDLLIRLRYALDLKESDMVEIFKLGGSTYTREEVRRILINPQKEESATKEVLVCDNHMLETFLNGLITFKRGAKDTKLADAAGENTEIVTEKTNQAYSIKSNKDVYNVMLKKLKIALSLTGEEMLAIFQLASLTLSNSELSAVLRRQGQRNYKECGERYAKNFLKGLAIKYRGKSVK